MHKSKRRKILMLIANEVVYDGRVMRAARALSAKYDVEVLGWLRTQRDTPELHRMIATLPFRVHCIAARWSDRLPKNLMGYAARYIELTARFIACGARSRAWAVHAHELDQLPVGFLIARLTRAKLVWDAHELYPDQKGHFVNRNRSLHAVGVGMLRFFMRRCDAIIAANHYRAEIMRDEYGAPFLPHPIRNLPPYEEPPSSSSYLLQYAREHNPKIRRLIVHTGALLGRGEVILPALARLTEDIALVLVGYIDLDAGSLGRLLDEHGVRDRVIAHPPVPYADLRQKISGADLGFVSYQNNCRNNYFCASSKVAEYAMAGVPMVAVDFPPIREVLDEYGCGLCFEWDDPEDLAEKIRQCLGDAELLARMRRECLRAARATNWDQEQARLIAVFDDLDRRKRPHR